MRQFFLSQEKFLKEDICMINQMDPVRHIFKTFYPKAMIILNFMQNHSVFFHLEDNRQFSPKIRTL